MKLSIKNITLYLSGLIIIGFGVIIMERAHLGMGAWDTVNVSLSHLLNINIGEASWIVNAGLLLFVLIYTKKFEHLLVVVTILLGGLLINFWDLIVFKNMVVNNLTLRILLTVAGVFILPFGLSLIISSTLPKGIFDEVTYSLMSLFKTKNFGLVRIFFEVFAIVLALTFGFLAKIGIGEIGYATLLVTFTIGPLINVYLNFYKKANKKSS